VDKLEILFNDENVHFSIGKYKFVIGNPIITFEFKKAIIGFFDKNSLSKYQENELRVYKVLINDTIIDKKQWNIFEVSHNYDLNTDLKLGSKSLLLKCFESLLKNIEFKEEVSTLNGLFGIIADEYIMSKFNFSSELIDLNVAFQEMNLTNLLKLLTVELLKEEQQANYYCLDYDEIILLQLDIIDAISSSNPISNYICILDLPIVTNEIYNKIKSIKSENIKYIIISNRYEDNYFTRDNTFILAEENLDLFDEETIYEITLNHRINMSIKEMQEYILNNLEKECVVKKTDLFLKKLIK